jgi:hypothetical protein
MGFQPAVMFRPGIIRPMQGVRSKTAWYRLFYTVAGPLLTLLLPSSFAFCFLRPRLS